MDIDQRIDWFEQRIQVGRGDGSQSPQEAYRVQTQVHLLRRDFHGLVARDGGHLYPDDRLRLEAPVNNLSDSIYWLRHNDVVRPW